MSTGRDMRLKRNPSQRPRVLRRVLLFLPLIGLVVFGGVLGERGQAATQQKAVRIAYFVPLQQNRYWAVTIQAMKNVGRRENATVQIFSAGFDAAKQFSQVQDAIATRRYDAFIITPVNSVSIIPVVKQAVDAGIKVAASGTPIGRDLTTVYPQVPGVVSSVLNPPEPEGAFDAQLVVAACKGVNPCKVAYIVGTFGYVLSEGQLRGFGEHIKKHRNVKLVAKGAGQYLPEGGFKAMQDIIQAHRDLNVVASAGEQMLKGAQLALENAGLGSKIGKQIKLVGDGGTQTAVKRIKAGTWFGSVITLPDVEGRIPAEHVIKAVRGEPIADPGIFPPDLSPVGLFLTKENVGRFRSRWDA